MQEEAAQPAAEGPEADLRSVRRRPSTHTPREEAAQSLALEGAGEPEAEADAARAAARTDAPAPDAAQAASQTGVPALDVATAGGRTDTSAPDAGPRSARSDVSAVSGMTCSSSRSTFESQPSKSVADFVSRESVATPNSAATSELEVKLRQRMLKCEGQDAVYKPQSARQLENPAPWAPARLKQTLLMKTEALKDHSPRSEGSSGVTLVDELVRTASYQRCTKVRAQSAHSLTRAKTKAESALDGAGTKQMRPRSEGRDAASNSGPNRQACDTGRGVWKKAASEPATPAGEPQELAVPEEQQQQPQQPEQPQQPQQPLSPPSNGGSGSPELNSTAGQREACEPVEVTQGVATFALDDPARDALEEKERCSDTCSRTGTLDLQEDHAQGDVSVEECLLDLVNHVPPKLAQKLGFILRRLEEVKRAGVLGQAGGACGPSAGLSEELEAERRCTAGLEEELAERLSTSTREAMGVVAAELQDALERQNSLVREDEEDSRMQVEEEVLRASLVEEQAQFSVAQQQLLLAEDRCRRLEEESRASQAELLGLRAGLADEERRQQASERRTEACSEEVAGCRAAEERLAAAVRAQREASALEKERIRAELDDARGSRSGPSLQDARLLEEVAAATQRLRASEAEQAVLQEDAEQAEAERAELEAESKQLAAKLVKFRRQEDSASADQIHQHELADYVDNLELVQQAQEEQLQQELSRSRAEAQHHWLRAEAAEQLRSEGNHQFEEVSADLANVVSSRDWLRNEIDSETEFVKQERAEMKTLQRLHIQLRLSEESLRAKVEGEFEVEVWQASTSAQGQEEHNVRGSELEEELRAQRAACEEEQFQIKETHSRMRAVEQEVKSAALEARAYRRRYDATRQRMNHVQGQDAFARREMNEIISDSAGLKEGLAVQHEQVQQERQRCSALEEDIQRLKAEKEHLHGLLCQAGTARNEDSLLEEISVQRRAAEREGARERLPSGSTTSTLPQRWSPAREAATRWGQAQEAAGGSLLQEDDLETERRGFDYARAQARQLEEVNRVVQLETDLQRRRVRHMPLTHQAVAAHTEMAVAQGRGGEDLRRMLAARAIRREGGQAINLNEHIEALAAGMSMAEREMRAMTQGLRQNKSLMTGNDHRHAVCQQLCARLAEARARRRTSATLESMEEAVQAPADDHAIIVNIYRQWQFRNQMMALAREKYPVLNGSDGLNPAAAARR